MNLQFHFTSDDIIMEEMVPTNTQSLLIPSLFLLFYFYIKGGIVMYTNHKHMEISQ